MGEGDIEAGRKKLDERMLSRSPMKRWADADEIAQTIAFLASEQSGLITGATIPVVLVASMEKGETCTAVRVLRARREAHYTGGITHTAVSRARPAARVDSYDGSTHERGRATPGHARRESRRRRVGDRDRPPRGAWAVSLFPGGARSAFRVALAEAGRAHG